MRPHPRRRRRALGPRAVGYALEQEGFEVTLAVDGDDAEPSSAAAEDADFDLLILDIMMPGRSGLDVCRDVRARSPVPIILLTAKDAEVDKVVGLEVGADDYVTKPFSVRELLGRVRAQLRRRELDRAVSPAARRKTIDAGDGAIDLARHLVTVRGEPVNLTRSEFQVLRLLAEQPGPGLQPAGDHGGALAVGVLAATSAPATSTSRTCARRSSATPRTPSWSSRCAASATASPRASRLNTLAARRRSSVGRALHS